MLIRIFRSGYVIKIFMFLIVSVLLWIPAFLSPPATISGSTFGIGYDFLIGYLNFPDLIKVIIAFILLLGQAIIFNAVLVANPLFSRSVFLPALVYVILMSYDPAHLTIHPSLIANFFLVFALKNLYNTYEKKEALRESFNTSFWVACASLIYLPALSMMLLVWSAFLIFRINSWREWLISFIGMATPWVWLFVGSYLTDGLSFLSDYYPDNFSWIWAEFHFKTIDFVFWPAFLVLLLISYYRFSTDRGEKIISVRKGFAVVNAYLFIAALTMTISAQGPHQHAFLLFPPSAVIIAYYFIESKKMFWAELLFFILLVAIAVIKFM